MKDSSHNYLRFHQFEKCDDYIDNILRIKINGVNYIQSFTLAVLGTRMHCRHDHLSPELATKEGGRQVLILALFGGWQVLDLLLLGRWPVQNSVFILDI